MLSLEPEEVVINPVNGRRYRIGEVLGEGGFGRAYRAEEINKRGKLIQQVCFKTTLDQTSWHRESYFGELLSHSKRVIKMIDSFPLAIEHRREKMLFCLALELAEHGTIADYLEKTGKAWPEERAGREIRALLKLLDQLHGASATHRDITPMNIFVCRNGTLKLGDFGIARHEIAGQPRHVEAFNPEFVTQGFRDSRHRQWLTVDDVFQMGQLLVTLLRGEVDQVASVGTVNKLEIKEELKSVIKKAIGPRSSRFADAFEMLQAMRGDDGPSRNKLRSLRDKVVVFTGPMAIKRFDAEVLVLQAGGTVARRVNREIDVVVQGGRSQLYKSGHKGRKLQDAEKLMKQGHPLHIIGEPEFRRLTRLAWDEDE